MSFRTDQVDGGEPAREVLCAQEWQATFDAIPDALCLLDHQCTVLQANHAAKALLDLSERELLGKPWGQVSPFCAEGVPAAVSVLERARASGYRGFADQLLHNRWYRIQVDPLLDEAARVRRFVLLIVDITDEKRAGERLAQINEALQSYAHSISHDIKGPLAGAITANQVLQQLLGQPLTDACRANIRELGTAISASIGKSLALIDEVLALAETGAGPGGATDLRRIIDRVLEDRREVIADRGVTVQLDAELGHVFAAPAHMYQVFANLVDNAIKHGAGPRVRICIRRLDSPGRGVHRFLFRDDGPGVHEELGSRIFDAFVKGDRATDGSGIGLTTVKRVLAAYGGSILAHNDEGACFELELRDAIE